VMAGKYSFRRKRNIAVNCSENIWTQRSSQCKDLIKRMLTYDPESRISCQEALDHPWVRQKVHIELSPLHMNEAISNLKAFTVSF
jgi:serine/threonine protein kinase